MICRVCGKVTGQGSSDGKCFKCIQREIRKRKVENMQRRMGNFNRIFSGGLVDG